MGRQKNATGSSTYVVTSGQQMLEESLVRINEYGYKISELKDIKLGNNHNHYSEEEQVNMLLLLADFENALIKSTYEILEERHMVSVLIKYAGVMRAPKIADTKAYDLKYVRDVVICDVYDGMYQIKTKGDNKGKLRADTYQDRPEYAYQILRTYILNANIYDKMEKLKNIYDKETGIEEKTDDGKEVNKTDRAMVNNNGSEGGYENDIVNKCSLSNEFSKKTIDTVLSAMPEGNHELMVAACFMLLEKFDASAIRELYDISAPEVIIERALENLEALYSIDLSYYKDIDYREDYWLRTYRELDRSGLNEKKVIYEKEKKIKGLLERVDARLQKSSKYMTIERQYVRGKFFRI